MKIYSAAKIPQNLIDKVENEGFEIEFHDELTTPSEDLIMSKTKDADAIISAVNVNITDKIIENAKNLKVIANIGAGTNNIAIDKATEKGVVVTNTPGRDSVASTAEHAIALMLSISRNVQQNQNMVEDNSFNGWQVMGYLGGHQVSYKKLLIVGFGNIGQEIAKMAKAFNMDIYFYNTGDISRFDEASKETGAKYIDFDKGLEIADYVILQMNFKKGNRHFIGENEFSKMKESAFLINTARGGIVDEKALYNAIKEGEISGAALDVHEEEPHFNEKLIHLENVLMTPHTGNDTVEARNEMAQMAIDQAIKALNGKELDYKVN